MTVIEIGIFVQNFERTLKATSSMDVNQLNLGS